MILTKVFNFEKEEAGIQFQISSELFPILRVKESDNFAGYNFNSRSKERERACFGSRGVNIAVCTQRGDMIHRERKRERERADPPHLTGIWRRLTSMY